jgi:hypothetical protein
MDSKLENRKLQNGHIWQDFLECDMKKFHVPKCRWVSISEVILIIFSRRIVTAQNIFSFINIRVDSCVVVFHMFMNPA